MNLQRLEINANKMIREWERNYMMTMGDRTWLRGVMYGMAIMWKLVQAAIYQGRKKHPPQKINRSILSHVQ